jgi:hypothetical protein
MTAPSAAPRGHADDARLGQRVGEAALHARARRRQRRADDHAEHHAREADVPQHLIGDGVPVAAHVEERQPPSDGAENLAERDREGADRGRHKARDDERGAQHRQHDRRGRPPAHGL